MGDIDPTSAAAGPGSVSDTELTGLERAYAEAADLYEPMAPEDAALLDELSAALASTDPVPPSLVEAAKQSWTWRTVDADIAALVGDTAAEPAKVRAGESEGRRLLTFEVGATAVVLEVDVVGRMRRLLGQIVRPRAAEVEVRHPGGSVSVSTDETGRFAVPEVPAGPLSLVCRFLDDVTRPVATSWVTV